METIQLLAKLGEYQYMKRLIKYGELYLRPISDFTKIENKGGIGDKYENMISYCSPKDPTITILSKNGEKIQLPPSARIVYGEHSDRNNLVYCMTMVDFNKDDTLTIKDSENINKIGSNYDTMVLIYNQNKLFARIEDAAKKLSWEIEYKCVNYYPEKNIIKKNLTAFDKRNSYSYQKEFRFCFSSYDDKPRTLTIGNIEDIAVIIKAQPIKNND